MQLPHSKVRQAYVDKIKIIETNLKDATSGERDEALLKQAQARLDSLAETYQYNEEIGSARYKMYELQALVHYFNGNDDDALDFINQAIETRGENYAKAQKLKTKLLEQPAAHESAETHPSTNLSKSDMNIINAREAVQSAGLWPIVSGIVLLLVGLIALFTASSGADGSLSLIIGFSLVAVSVYFFYSGYKLNKCDSSDDFIKRILGINIILSILTIWSIFPLISLIMSIIALRRVRELNGKFKASMQKFAEVEARIHRFQNKHSIFFYRSPFVVALLTVATFGLYSIYWTYKHWVLIGKSTGQKTHPIISSIFVVFTIYPLIKRIRDGAASHGYRHLQNAGLVAAGFIVLMFLSNSLARIEVNTPDEAVIYLLFSTIFAAAGAAIMAVIQRAANAHNTAKLGKSYKFRSAYVGEIIIVIIGIILVLLTTWAVFDEANSAEINRKVDTLNYRIDALQEEYDTCANRLKSREASLDIYSSYEVDSYNREWDRCEQTRLELNDLIDEYNHAAGFEEA